MQGGDSNLSFQVLYRLSCPCVLLILKRPAMKLFKKLFIYKVRNFSLNKADPSTLL